MLKKILAIILVLALCLSALSGCGKADNKESKNTAGNNVDNSPEDSLKIVCTIFPQYDWVRQILGDRISRAELTLLQDNGVDLHNYQPTTDDIITISSCDLFIYVGGESDEWVEDVLAEAGNDGAAVINMLELLGEAAKEEELVEGMEAEEEEAGEAEEEEGIEYDEHVWLSLRNAETICRSINEAVGRLDPDNSAVYQSNLDHYIDQLKELDQEYKDTVEQAAYKSILVGDRFPFRYLADDYHLDYYAAFAGCSAETEASFNTIVFLSEKLKELQLPAVLVLENSSQRIAESIIRNSGTEPQILVMNSIQSVTAKDIEEGISYLAVMQENLVTLETAIN